MGEVCFFNSTPFWGGGEKWHLENAAALARRGHGVVVVGRSGSPVLVRAKEIGLDTEGFPITTTRWLDPLLLNRIRGFFVRRQTEVVVFNGPLDIKVGGLAAKAAGVPRRVYRRGLARPIRDRWLNRYLFDHVLTHVIANSEATREMLLRDIRTRLRRSDVSVIPNGLDLDAFDRNPFQPVFQRLEGQLVLGNVGRLTTQKGHSILLDVALLLKSRGVAFRLLVAGTGDLHRELVDRAGELGVQSHVEFLGFVDDVPSFLASLDIFVLSSLWEGFGYAIAEAGAASLPTVAFDVSSNPEVIEQGTTGYLVPAGDVSSFAARVQELIERPDLRRTMGAAARAAVERQFQLDRTVDQLESVLRG